MSDDIPHHVQTFPISVVKNATKLTARQIRYYEEHGLIKPNRNEGNQRVYSLNDIQQLKEVKLLIEQGINIAGIKKLIKKEF
ncbi:hypothetical protein GCM10007216_31160 [Thalassobacillus devorans]|uniref:HTH merR-type domain-containing protein n=1 Tax=Thalassobacillus devorans TaxID=279813 RepID=A0ABQ1PJA3_9BACI|nr:MerR family transcriptional regulator [Thalassobacillus devorans]NIK30075.1 MerR family glutamine synthetase transcriptional repressor [Thalassobacillus devorans]GGC98148.1 hypothetical protein GCM10007216_31160 [Thalassobacillus devorans]